MGNLEEGSSTGDFKRRMKGALGMGLLSLTRLRGGDVGCGGSSFTGDPGRYVQIVSGYGHPLHRGSYSTEGNLVFGGGGSYAGDFAKWMKEGSLLWNSRIC